MDAMLQEMQNVLNMWNSAVSAVNAVILTVTALFALLECFFGFKLMKLAFAVCGFLLGSSLGFVISAFTLNAQTAGIIGVSVLLGGIVGAILLFRIYLLGVFLSNMLLTLLLFLLLFGVEPPVLVIGMLCGIVIGVLSVKFVRVWVIFSTGISGGMLAGRSLVTLVLGSYALPMTLAGVLLSTLGILFQWKTTAHAPKKAAAKPAAATAYEQENHTEAAPAMASMQESNTQPAVTAVSAREIQTETPSAPAGKLHDLWQDKTKRKFLLAGTGVAMMAIMIGVVAGGAAGSSYAIEKSNSGYFAADGSDLMASVLWLPEGTEQVDDYAEGETTALALVEMNGSKYILNRSGKTVVQGDGLYFAGEIDGEPCAHDSYTGNVYDTQGNILFSTKDISYGINEIGAFSDGLCPVYRQTAYQVQNGQRGELETSGWIVLDTEGNTVLTLGEQYERVNAFRNGYAIVRKNYDGFQYTFGLIDRTGSEVIPCQYFSLLYAPDNATLIAEDENQNYGAFDRQGNMVEPFLYTSKNDLLEALGMYEEKQPQLTEEESFNLMTEHVGGDTFIVQDWESEQMGLMNTAGELLLPVEQQSVVACEEQGLLCVTTADNQMYFCDWTGQQRTPVFAWVDPLEGNVDRTIRQDGRLGILPRIIMSDELQSWMG